MGGILFEEVSMSRIAYARSIQLSHDVEHYLVYARDGDKVDILYSRTYVLGQSVYPNIERHRQGYLAHLRKQGWTIEQEPTKTWTRGRKP